jgi:hypothetical protein
MATRTAQVVTLNGGAFRVVITYDDQTTRLSRIDAINTSPRPMVVSLTHPTSGRVFDVTIPPGQTVGRNIPGNRTLRFRDSQELGGVDDWPTIAVRGG